MYADEAGNQEELASWLYAHDNGPYPAYHDMEGTWKFDGFTFTLDHAQADPYASPSKARLKVAHSYAQFPVELRDTTLRRTALADYLLRSLYRVCTSKSYDEKLQGGGWSGAKGGQIQVDVPGQQVLERTAVMIDDEGIEVRFALGLPARGRSIMGRLAASVCAYLPSHHSMRKCPSNGAAGTTVLQSQCHALGAACPYSRGPGGSA